MPHTVFNLGSQVATADVGAKQLAPGIEPGGSRAGRATKPAIAFLNASLEINDFDGAVADTTYAKFFLKLSQDQDLNPGLLLPIGELVIQGDGTNRVAWNERLTWTASGTLWVAKWVGVRIVEQGTITTMDVDVHLDYDVVDVPWMDWFLMWEWLDNVVDNSRDY